MYKVYTSYYAKTKGRSGYDTVYVTVSNTKPHWYDTPHEDMRELSPSWNIINDYKEGRISYAQFKEAYRNELISRYETVENIRELILCRLNVVSEIPIVLLCWEKNGNECHRTALAEFVFPDEYLGEL